MIGIVVTTHGDLGKGLLHAANMMAGEQEGVIAVALDEHGVEDFAARINQTLDEMTEKYEKVIVLCDLQGGTPCNQSLKYGFTHEGKIKVVSGVNLPMLVETMFGRNEMTNLEELANFASNLGKEAIESITL